MPPAVLIVDDHAGFRAFARALLESEGYAVVGEAADAAGALAETLRLRPDLVLLDVQLPDADGFEVAERLAGLDAPPAVVLISTREATAYRRRLPASPARGFIAKELLTPAALAAVLG